MPKDLTPSCQKRQMQIQIHIEETRPAHTNSGPVTKPQARAGKHKLGPTPIKTNWGPGPANTNWVPGPVNKHRGPRPRASARGREIQTPLANFKNLQIWILSAFDLVWIDLNFVFTGDLSELSTSFGFWTFQDAAWTLIYELGHENLGWKFGACQHLIFELWTLNFELWTSSFALHCLECLDFRLNFFKHCLNFGTLFEAI